MSLNDANTIIAIAGVLIGWFCGIVVFIWKASKIDSKISQIDEKVKTNKEAQDKIVNDFEKDQEKNIDKFISINEEFSHGSTKMALIEKDIENMKDRRP